MIVYLMINLGNIKFTWLIFYFFFAINSQSWKCLTYHYAKNAYILGRMEYMRQPSQPKNLS